MATVETFRAWSESLATLSYYEILRVDRAAPAAKIQEAFHALSLSCHPDRFVDETDEVRTAAANVFKRVVEAYNVLKRPNLRARYDAELREGKVSFDEHAIKEKPTFAQRTLGMIAKTAKSKVYAEKAERFIAIGRLEDARIQLISACQHDPSNAELKERLAILYEALTLEPP